MSNRTRTILIALLLSMIGYAVVAINSPQSLTPTNEALGALFALAAAIVLNRRREGRGDDVQPFRADSRPPAAPGRDYEETCRQVLKSLGWDIVHTPGSRDRGADLYAMKRGVRLLVQCKQYRGAVSYRAVSEVLAARNFYPAEHLCVVAPSDFTRDAKAAARDAGVKLLHHDELRRYARNLA
jgi:hypothetical protein